MPPFYDFTKISNNQLAKLKSVATKKATTIIVHPYWWKINPAFDIFISKSRTEQLMVIFEEEAQIKSTIERISAQGKDSKIVFLVVPTQKGRGTPKIGWSKFFKRFDLLEARRIIIGGNSFIDITKEELMNSINTSKKNRYSSKSTSTERTILRAMQSKHLRSKTYHDLGECAGTTAARFMARRRGPKVRITKKFTYD